MLAEEDPERISRRIAWDDSSVYFYSFSNLT